MNYIYYIIRFMVMLKYNDRRNITYIDIENTNRS